MSSLVTCAAVSGILPVAFVRWLRSVAHELPSLKHGIAVSDTATHRRYQSKNIAIQFPQMPDERPLETLEAVYYPAQVPSSLEALTFLGFLFDRVHFPGVYLPPPGSLDLPELDKQIQEIVAHRFNDIETIQMLNSMAFAGKMDCISDFCVFDGSPDGPTVDALTPPASSNRTRSSGYTELAPRNEDFGRGGLI